MSYGNEILVPAYSGLYGLGNETVTGNAIPLGSNPWSNPAAANRAYFIPLYLPSPGIITKLWVQNGTTATGNCDIGLYSCVAGWPSARLVSTGSTAQAGTSVMQEFNITDLAISGNTTLFLAVVFDSASSTIFGGSVAANVWRFSSCAIQSTAFPLPSTATPVVVTSPVAPLGCGIAFRALVA